MARLEILEATHLGLPGPLSWLLLATAWPCGPFWLLEAVQALVASAHAPWPDGCPLPFVTHCFDMPQQAGKAAIDHWSREALLYTHRG